MIKIQNNIATREPIPAFLQGLAPESLADLSWTDSALGVSDCAWWPEVDQSPELNEYQRYGAETLTIDHENQQVIVTRNIEPWTPEEIAADKKSKVPRTVTMRQGRLALLAAGLLDQVETALSAIPDETDRRMAQIEWEYAQTIDRNSTWVSNLADSLGLSDDQLDDLFTAASTI